MKLDGPVDQDKDFCLEPTRKPDALIATTLVSGKRGLIRVVNCTGKYMVFKKEDHIANATEVEAVEPMPEGVTPGGPQSRVDLGRPPDVRPPALATDPGEVAPPGGAACAEASTALKDTLHQSPKSMDSLTSRRRGLMRLRGL